VTDVLDLMEVQDGKITSFIEFCDTAAVDRMTAAL
jgi:ketosteroid isomerase-like protein